MRLHDRLGQETDAVYDNAGTWLARPETLSSGAPVVVHSPVALF